MIRGEMTFCLGESSSCESQPGAVDVEDQGHVLGVLGVWMDVILADMCVEAAEDLHRPGLWYRILLIFLRLE